MKTKTKQQQPNVVLLKYQQEWLADDSDVKFWEKSRRIGATWCEAADAVLIASRAKNPMDYYYTSINEDLSKEFIREAANWAERFNIAIESVGETLFELGKQAIRVQQILFASGKKIMGVPSNPSVLRGRHGVLCCDEFAFIENPKELLKAGMAFLMWGGKLRILSTHNGEDSHFNEVIKDIRAGRVKYSLHRTTLDDALNDGLYKRICLRTDRQWSRELQDRWREDLIDFYREGYLEELFCVPTNSSGAYFPRILVENAMNIDIRVFNLTLKDEFFSLGEQEKESEVLDWCRFNLQVIINSLNPNYRSSFGFDFGRKGDLSYFILFQELPNLVRKTAFALELRNVPFRQQEQILFWIIDRLPRFVGGAFDAVGNGAYLAENAAARYGEHLIFQVPLSLIWYRENMPKYKAALEDQKVILPSNSDLLDDHRAIEVIKGVPKLVETRKKGTDGKQRHGDGVIACALGWFASLNDCEDIYVGEGSSVTSIWDVGWFR